MTDHAFALDDRLAQDALPILDLPLSRVLLMNDARYPWLILVPRRAHARELTDLTIGDQAALLAEVNRVAGALPQLATFEKLNIGLLGNIVRQLHVHIVGRRDGDPAWPGPVWGAGEAIPYPADEAKHRIDTVRQHLSASGPTVYLS